MTDGGNSRGPERPVRSRSAATAISLRVVTQEGMGDSTRRSQQHTCLSRPRYRLKVGLGHLRGCEVRELRHPADKEQDSGNRGGANAMREAHEAAAYNQWLAGEIHASIDDPRPGIRHDEVMAEMDADIAVLPEKKRA